MVLKLTVELIRAKYFQLGQESGKQRLKQQQQQQISPKFSFLIIPAVYFQKSELGGKRKSRYERRRKKKRCEIRISNKFTFPPPTFDSHPSYLRFEDLK